MTCSVKLVKKLSEMPALRCALIGLTLWWSGTQGAIAFGVQPVHLNMTISPANPRPGEIVVVSAEMQIDKDYHVYSSQRGTTVGPQRTEIVSLGNWKPVGETVEDVPIIEHDPGFDIQIGVHLNHALFQRAFAVPKAAGTLVPDVTIHYQACNKTSCLPPRTDVIHIGAKTGVGTVRPQYLKPIFTADSANAPQVSANADGPIAPGGNNSFFLFLLAAAGGGLLALATPCVFPLIPIILTTFVKQSDGSRTRFVSLAIGFSAGIVLLFAAIGSVFAALFGASKIGAIATNPIVNLVEFALFVMFALSFFEVINLQLPAGLSGLQRSKKSSSIVGLALMGAAFVIASFTCTAPFVGTLLVSAASGAVLKPLLGMIVFALFFTLPFLVSAISPSWIDRVPRSGVWLAKTKAVIGFVELAAALKFLSNADLVWQWHLLTKPVLLGLWAIIFAGAALYLFGVLRWGITAEGPRSAPSKLQMSWGVLFLAITAYCVWGASNGPISPYVEAFLPAADYGRPGYGETLGLPWESNYVMGLAEAKAKHLPLIIDFTGYTCSNCRLNEHNVFPDPAVQSLLGKFVRVQLYTDGGASGPDNQALQLKLFSDVSLPLYGIIDPTTGKPVQKIGGVLRVSQFKSFLQAGSVAR